MTPRAGASLPLVILLLVLGLVGAVAGTSRLGSERRIDAEHEGRIHAEFLARSGLERYLLQPPDLAARDAHDTVLTTLAGGTVTISARRLYTGTPPLWLVRARASFTAGTRHGGDQEPGIAEEAQIASFSGGGGPSGSSAAAWLHVGFVRINSNGNDAAFDGRSAGLPGLATVRETETNNEITNTGRYPFYGKLNGAYGNWATLYNTAGAAEATIPPHIRDHWSAIRAGTKWAPHGFVDQNNVQTGQFAPFKVVLATVPGDVNINSGQTLAGSGILIIPNNLNVSGTLHWDGYVLVGNRVHFNSGGSTQIVGSLLSGLNGLLTPANPLDFAETSTVNTGAVLVEYNAFKLQQALTGAGGSAGGPAVLTRIGNARVAGFP